jgi:caffeoyl-CoA O-methyltransferase
MTRRSITVDEKLHEYLVAHGSPPDEVLRDLSAETYRALPDRAGMQIGPEQAAFITLLTKLIGATNAVEVGTFTGMSSLAIARGLAAGGTLICFDVSTEFTAIAQRYWERDGVADRVELRIGDARDGLRNLPQEPHLDLAFIDADKPGYRAYWEALVPRMRTGGVIIADNVLWSGRVLDADDDSESTRAIRDFNSHAAADERMELVMLPIGDGVSLARKR